MAAAELSKSSPRSWAVTVIIVLLLPQLIGLFGLFPRYAFSESAIELRVFAVAVALFTLLTLAGLRLRKPWALWATLVVVSVKAVMDLSAWAHNVDPTLTPVSMLLLVVIVILVFRQAAPPVAQVGVYQRVLFGLVLAFAVWVAFWGLFFPAQIGSYLPITVAPLHARFLGAIYLSGSVFMVLGILAKQWHEARVVTVILAVWTGMLGLVSTFNLAAFDWSRGPTWFWFLAYFSFPLIAFWVAWCQRHETAHPARGAISEALRVYLMIQGGVCVSLALGLLVASRFMTTVWPWAIPALAAQIYGAPFLAYGLGSLYAARQRAWVEVRIAVLGTLVFTLGVLAASMLHANLFDMRAPSAWLWFGGFGVAGLALLFFAGTQSLRTRASSRAA
jgi:hypothetical protein